MSWGVSSAGFPSHNPATQQCMLVRGVCVWGGGGGGVGVCLLQDLYDRILFVVVVGRGVSSTGSPSQNPAKQQ